MKNTKIMKNARILKWLLVIQSFFPLFLLLLIRYWDISVFTLTGRFFGGLLQGDIRVFGKAWHHAGFLTVILHMICILMIAAGLLIYWIFDKIQKYGFEDKGEKIIAGEDTTAEGSVFLLTYVTPLFLDDLNEGRGFLCFLLLLTMTVLLMRNTNLYYQNPILCILGYKTFRFEFSNAGRNGMSKEGIAITRGNFDKNQNVKWKHIADNVYLVYNK